MLLVSIKNDINASLKKHDSVRVETLRFLVSAIKYAEIALYGADGESKLTDQDVLDVVKKQVKTRKESIDAFDKAGRPELSAKEQSELVILQEFLPKELSDEELKVILDPVAKSGEKNFGLMMKQGMAAVKGQADGGRVSTILKTLVSSST